MTDPETGEQIDPETVQCKVDPNMVKYAKTYAKWYGAPPSLFCAPKSLVPEAPRWNLGGWCPTQNPLCSEWQINDPNVQCPAPPFQSMLQGEVHYGPGPPTSNVPPELLA